MNQLRHLLALQLLLASSTVAAPDVWVVDDDGGPGVDFTTIQGAVNAASNLDTVLVKAGTYSSVLIDGKSLHLVAELGETVVLDGAQLVVRNLASTQIAVVRGIDVVAPRIPFFPPPSVPPEGVAGLVLRDNLGRVWIEDCNIEVPQWILGFAGIDGPGGYALNCASVTLVRSRFAGPAQSFEQQPLAANRGGLSAAASNLYLHDCELVGAGGPGGIAAFGSCTPGELGGAGLSLDGGFLYASGTLFRGGDGLAGNEAAGVFTPGEGGDGGHGLWLLDGASSSAQLRDCAFTPGTGGVGGAHFDNPGQPLCPAGTAGNNLAAGIHPVSFFPGAAPGLASDSPVRVGQVSNVVMSGEPFDYVILAAAALQTAIPLPIYAGTLHLGGTPVNIPYGFLDAGGAGALPIFLPPNPSGFEAFTYYLQTVHVTLALEVVLGPPATLTAVDPAAAP